MTTPDVTLAVPVRDAGPRLQLVLDAVRGQQTARSVELLVCDSGSADGSVAVARSRGARVLKVAARDFSHGGTRNLLAREARGRHIVFLTQDSVPATPHWLDRLLDAFGAAPDVGLAFGPYVPREGATPMTARELESFFATMAADGGLRVDRLADARALPARELLGPRAFFTDANGCVARAAWERVPFRDVPYGEDHQLAIDMLRAGYAKVFVPDAAVEHSHEYSAVRRVQRCFDEWRALREIYGWVQPLDVTVARDRILAPARADLRWARERGAASRAQAALAVRAVTYHAARTLGAALGSRHRRLPPVVRHALSLEGRATFAPLERRDLRPS